MSRATITRTPAVPRHVEMLGAGVLNIPAPTAQRVDVRFAPLTARDHFAPNRWRHEALKPSFEQAGYFEIDLDQLNLADGEYEYEFIIDDRTDAPVPDPYAEEITRFGRYRGIFRMQNGRRVRWPFSWDDERTDGKPLPNNNQIVIYEMPLRWMASASEDVRQVGLGTFEDVIFDRLDDLENLGINAIELLPIQDSADTLNWGYGSRFFFAPDLDMGTPIDLKILIKRCHQRGIRVILDVVMNHSRKCPMEDLAEDWFYLRDGSEEGGRPSWGGRLFRYRRPAPDGHFPAREFHYRMAEFWVREYHVDGFRIDEFKGIDHWEFIQTFRDRATAAHQQLFPDRPFLVIAEDSWRRAAAAQDRGDNPGGRRVVDAIWNFSYRDEGRRLMRNQIHTNWGEPSRRDRIVAMVSGRRTWDEWDRRFKDGFGDLAQAVSYFTSHDVEGENEQRLMNFLFGELLRQRHLGDGSVSNVRGLLDHLAQQSAEVRAAHDDALDQVRSAFAVLVTSVGIPMLLAGEEFADIHDLEHGDYRLKMSDPVDWTRRGQPGHQVLWDRVRELFRLRTTHSALQRNEVEFFYFHPEIDSNDGVRVFAYCRTDGRAMGSRGQVVVVANCGPHDFASFDLPWPWSDPAHVVEHAAPVRAAPVQVHPGTARVTLSLAPFQVRMFSV